MRVLMSLAFLAVLSGPALAADVAVEETPLGDMVVRLHVLPSLREDELTTLRLVATNDQALAVFVPEGGKGFSAMAISPSEGFIRDGAPVGSAAAISGLDSAEAAAKAAVDACEAARDAASEPCALVLEIAPKG